MDDMAMAIESSLKDSGWHLKPNCVLAILRNLSHDSTLLTPASHSLVLAHLLDTDLHDVGAACLPDSSSLRRMQRLGGPLVLQVMSVRNICESSSKSTVIIHQQQGRLLRIGLTDGHTNVFAIEYRSMPAFSLSTAPGTKVKLENNISVQNGILLGDAGSLTVLGGHVQALYEAWELEQKYSALGRSTLKIARIEGDTGPPPFHGLSVARQESQGTKKHSLMRQQQQEPIDTPKRNTMTRLANPGKGILQDNFGMVTETQSDNDIGKVFSSRVKPGKEPYKSPMLKTSVADVSTLETENDWSVDMLPDSLLSPDAVKVGCGASTSYHSENEKGLQGLMPSNISSSRTLASSDQDLNAPVGTQPKVVGIDARVDAIRAAIALGVETAPLQNRSAAQKLLEKRTDGDFKRSDGQSRGARGRGRRLGKHRTAGIDEDKATLTLDEWESRKGISNFSNNQAPGTVDDAALAQKLQHQLDLESNTVENVGTAVNEAEQIRLSMFNFTVDRSVDERGGEKRRGRGRGRGRRHGH